MQIDAVASYPYKVEGTAPKQASSISVSSTVAETTNCTPLTITEMASNQESLIVGKMLLDETRQRLEDKDELAKLMDHLEQMEREIDKIKNMLKIRPNQSVYNAPAEIFARLARTSTVPEVKSVISAAQHKIFILKSMLRTCENQHRNKIRAVLAQLEKSIHRANGKIIDLKQEEQIQWQRKKAEKLAEYRKAEQIKLELDRKKTMRRSRERAQINEGKRWFYYPEDFIGHQNLAVSQNDLSPIGTDAPTGLDNVVDTALTIDVLL